MVMPVRVSVAALGDIQKLFDWGALGSWTDSQLVERFLAGQEESEAAFRVLIQRHGPMVLGICRRILGDEHAAEDAFQATFLILVKKAGGLRDRGLLTSWLYGVAMKVSHKERARGARRRDVERSAAEQAPRIATGPEPGDLQSVIDEEIRRLPERYRVPLVLCHVEGLRHEEVARRLGCPVGTVESRLSRAREQLRTRLARRGLAPTGSAIAALLRPPGAGWIRPALVESTLSAATRSLGREVTRWAAARALIGRAARTVTGASILARSAVAGMVIALGVSTVGLGLAAARKPAPPPEPITPPIAVPVPVALTPPPDPQRTPQAVARPLSGITIDGRLDDWPDGLPKYPIQSVLTHLPDSYRTGLRTDGKDLEADFMAGYDPRDGLIYLAVVVRDDEHVIYNNFKRPAPGPEYLLTDAVEVYIDAAFSNRRIPLPNGDWGKLDAARMPVLQYVGIAAEVPAYGDRWGGNPSLIYARSVESDTRMAYRRDEEAKVTTYEWAIRAYDHFPDAPTRLVAGRRIGLEVAVVDKDSGRTKPAFVTWGPPPEDFKGLDAGSLGELYLAEGP
jgi:RNA polymerase sigma factor (sigma-70 family)